jgi:hypothetical protein
VVAQFYATLAVDEKHNEMHFALCGKRFSVPLLEFATIFKLCGVANNNDFIRNMDFIHDANELEVHKMRFMYDSAYGDIKLGESRGLTPFYKMMNQLFCFTICPRGGDSNNISHRARNLLFQMAPPNPRFNVCDYLWSEIIICSYTASSGCHFAPYIHHLVKTVTGLNIRTDGVHESYKTKKGKIEQMLKIGSHATGILLKGPLPGAYPVDGPRDAGASSSQAPPLGPLPPHGDTHNFGVPKTKKGKFDFLARGIFACFNQGRQNARERERDRKWHAEKYHKIEKRQKELCAQANIPCSPLSEPTVFDPPPIDSPWEDLGFWVPVDDDEEDFGVGEFVGDDEEVIEGEN